ncbi:MAG: metallophosphoesterase family protein [Promethearchaeota archaeon]|nr:MAG: metallophosphoesterase family protein [Candidatus Lokiarchaeota archaeon]
MKKSTKAIIIALITFSIIISSIYYLQVLNQSYRESKSDDDGSDNLLYIPDPSIKGIRLTFIHDFNDSVVISWFTGVNSTDPKVLYSINPDLSGSLEIKPNSSLLSSSVYFYYAEINNLTPNKTYYYRVIANESDTREIMDFTTLPNENAKNMTFLVYGDSRTDNIQTMSRRTVRRVLVEKIMEKFKNQFQFSVHLGDIVYDGTAQFRWNNYFIDTEVLNAYKQGIYVEGNHENGHLSTKMYQNLPMINNETNRYYSFSYAGVGFIILNSNDYKAGDEDQTNWLNETLIEFSQKNRINFAFLHHPLLHDRVDPYFRQKWNPLFDKYNVSCIFCGHNHHYERSYPMINSSTLEYDNSKKFNYTDIDDSIYIVSGGAGAPLHDENDNDFIANNAKAYNFQLVNFVENSEKAMINIESWGMPIDYGNLYLIDNITVTRTI